VGCSDQQIVAGTASELLAIDFGGPLHSLVIVGDAHELELELLDGFSAGAKV
jgi:diphthine synthase